MSETQEMVKLEDWMIDQRIEEIKARNEEIERLEEIAKKRIEDIKVKLKEQVEKLQQANQRDMETIKQATLMHEKLKETKTQRRVDFLSGSVIIKKPKKVLVSPDKDMYKEIFNRYPEFKKVKEVESLDWANLKKRLKIIDDVVIDAETGENVTEVFQIKETEEELIIK